MVNPGQAGTSVLRGSQPAGEVGRRAGETPVSLGSQPTGEVGRTGETPVLLGSQPTGEVGRTGETPVLLGSQPAGFEPVRNMHRADAGSAESPGIRRHD